MTFTDEKLANEDLIKLLEFVKSNYFKHTYRTEVNRMFRELNVRLGDMTMRPVIDAVKSLLNDNTPEKKMALLTAIENIIINQKSLSNG